jgi:putative chitinase
MKITADLLVAALRIPRARAELWAPVMVPALQLADISTGQRLACWLAQVGHETLRLRYTRELWGPTPAQRRYEPPSTLAARLGNERPGDGRRYLGRGLIQVTGRANYARTTARLRALVGEAVPDFVVAPALLESPDWAALSAAAYWRDRGLNRYADAFDFVTLTRRINGGTNGLADRQTLYTQALGAIALGG